MGEARDGLLDSGCLAGLAWAENYLDESALFVYSFLDFRCYSPFIRYFMVPISKFLRASSQKCNFEPLWAAVYWGNAKKRFAFGSRHNRHPALVWKQGRSNPAKSKVASRTPTRSFGKPFRFVTCKASTTFWHTTASEHIAANRTSFPQAAVSRFPKDAPQAKPENRGKHSGGIIML